MALRGKLTAQLPLRARLTHGVRLARALAASALASFPLADLLAHALALLTPFRAFFLFEIAVLFERTAALWAQCPLPPCAGCIDFGKIGAGSAMVCGLLVWLAKTL